MPNAPASQSVRAVQLLQRLGMARLSEFTKASITAATVARMEQRGEVVKLGRGLYQLADAAPGLHHELAHVAKLVPSGVICLVSALAFHELTDTLPSRIWIAIGAKDRKPRIEQPKLQVVRFSAAMLQDDIERHTIEGVSVTVTTPAKTVVDLFRYRASAGRRYQKSPGLNLALEGLREALRQRKATPAEIARLADKAGIWKVVQPYLEAMTAHG